MSLRSSSFLESVCSYFQRNFGDVLCGEEEDGLKEREAGERACPWMRTESAEARRRGSKKRK